MLIYGGTFAYTYTSIYVHIIIIMYALGLRNTIATVIITIHYIGTISFTKCSYIAFNYNKHNFESLHH